MTSRAQENARTLAALIGKDERAAAQRLDITISITYRDADPGAAMLADRLEALLQRTVSKVCRNEAADASAEVAIGDATARSAKPIRLWCSDKSVVIGTGEPTAIGLLHPLVALVAACYATGAALSAALRDVLPSSLRSPAQMQIDLDAILGSDRSWLLESLDLGEMYLAGAGAIGNGLVAGLVLVDAVGTLHIADPDVVNDGNLNRCYWFSDDDLHLPKATQLSLRAQPFSSGIRLIPHDTTLNQIADRHNPNWLRTLIVGVDSRRMRRHLQTELPGEVFDSSTTGVSEIVLHHHRWPTEGACMACIYHEAPDELSRERGIAEALGVTLEDVTQHVISASAAQRIAKRYEHLNPAMLQGTPYDSLFKALCGEQILATPDQQQVLAPFAFVSTLAGALLAIEVCRRVHKPEAAYNYWRLSPWKPPVEALRQWRSKNEQCVVCSNPITKRVADSIWTPLVP